LDLLLTIKLNFSKNKFFTKAGLNILETMTLMIFKVPNHKSLFINLIKVSVILNLVFDSRTYFFPSFVIYFHFFLDVFYIFVTKLMKNKNALTEGVIYLYITKIKKKKLKNKNI
jgi:hypothetical protein